mmetsp:Transcript_33649/g.71807  ORF Transcript_33649/g.71807 Transcript_33649/m.71807 type:complete len:144 (-) Transcript_33649:319-750(-)
MLTRGVTMLAASLLLHCSAAFVLSHPTASVVVHTPVTSSWRPVECARPRSTFDRQRLRVCTLSDVTDGDGEAVIEEAVDAEYAKRLAFEKALKEAVLENNKPKEMGKAPRVAVTLAVIALGVSSMNYLFSPGAEWLTEKVAKR